MKYAGQKLVSQRIDKAAKKAQYKSKPRLPSSKIGILALTAKQAKIKESINVMLNPSLPGMTEERYEAAREFLKKHSPADLVTIRKALLKS